MLVKFIPTRKARTSIDKVLVYVFQEKDANGKKRPMVKGVAGVISELLSLIAMSVPSKTPYTHSVLSFSDSDIFRTTESQRLDILSSYINELAAGLGDKSRMPFVAVDHGDHFHVVTLRYDLKSGKVYQPFVKYRGDTGRFNAWKDVENAKYGFDAPTKSESLFRTSAKHVSKDVKNLLWMLNDEGRGVREDDGDISAHELLNKLKPLIQGEGFEVARITKSGFSVTTTNMKRNIRILFTRRCMGIDDNVEDDLDKAVERLACFREKLMLSMGRYHGGEMLDINMNQMKVSSSQLYSCQCTSRKSGNGISTFS